MQARTLNLEARPDFQGDPAARHLRRFLEAEQALAHAAARRRFLAHLIAVLAIPLWLLVVGVGPEVARVAGLILFAPFLAGFLLSVLAEQLWNRRVRDARLGIHVRPLREDRDAG